MNLMSSLMTRVFSFEFAIYLTYIYLHTTRTSTTYRTRTYILISSHDLK